MGFDSGRFSSVMLMDWKAEKAARDPVHMAGSMVMATTTAEGQTRHIIRQWWR
jgi:hypothetical protein